MRKGVHMNYGHCTMHLHDVKYMEMGLKRGVLAVDLVWEHFLKHVLWTHFFLRMAPFPKGFEKFR